MINFTRMESLGQQSLWIVAFTPASGCPQPFAFMPSECYSKMALLASWTNLTSTSYLWQTQTDTSTHTNATECGGKTVSHAPLKRASNLAGAGDSNWDLDNSGDTCLDRPVANRSRWAVLGLYNRYLLNFIFKCLLNCQNN